MREEVTATLGRERRVLGLAGSRSPGHIPDSIGRALEASTTQSPSSTGSCGAPARNSCSNNDAVIPLGVTFGHDPLMPNMGWLVHHGQAELFIQLPRQGF
jgi:hypothetical protein